MRLSSSSLVIASARTSCSVRSEKRFTAAPSLFRMTINNETTLTTRKRKRRPRRGAVRWQAWEESVPSANLTVRHRGERSRHVRVAQVHGRAPAEGPLVPEQVDDEGEGEHEFTASAG